MTFDEQGQVDTMDASSSLDPNMLEPGRVIAGRYRLGREVGSGAAGRTHLAQRISDGREVVLKIDARASRRSRDRMRSEARALAALDHPNVVGFVEHGETSDLAFVVMEAIHGETLEAHLRRGDVSRATAVLWLYELAQALDHVHAMGFVHRDVKPANVMVTAQGKRLVLVDFGLATEYRRARPPRDEQAFVVGTPEYMAPEQALGLESEIGPAADRYALAAIALELFTGERPYPPMTLGRLLATILEQPPRRPTQLGFGGPELDLVFSRAMAREPSRRHASGRELVEAVVAALPVRATGRPSLQPKAARTVRAKAA